MGTQDSWYITRSTLRARDALITHDDGTVGHDDGDNGWAGGDFDTAGRL
jgi:hypothetical protein